VITGWATRKWLSRPGSPSAEVAALAARLARWVIIIGTACVLSFVGVSIGWLATTVVAMLAVVFLIVRPQLEGLAAAVVVTTRPAFGVGDEVQVDKWRDEVVEVTSRSVVLRTRDGRRVHLPQRDPAGDHRRDLDGSRQAK
jgi:small conductance mechanosensitive channel